MTEKPTEKPNTHTAWIQKTLAIRKGRRIGPWIPEGGARFEVDASGEISGDIILHSLPVGGFSGHIKVTKTGVTPPEHTAAAPQRPGATDGDFEDDFED